MIILACGKDNILGHQSIFHNGELRKFNSFHTSDRIISTSPVELYVISRVAICRPSRRASEKQQQTGAELQIQYTWSVLWGNEKNQNSWTSVWIFVLNLSWRAPALQSAQEFEAKYSGFFFPPPYHSHIIHTRINGPYKTENTTHYHFQGLQAAICKITDQSDLRHHTHLDC